MFEHMYLALTKTHFIDPNVWSIGPKGDFVRKHDSSPPEVTYRETNVNATVGRFYRMKYRDFTSNGSYYEAAKNLRKQGVPVGIALLILTGRA